MSLEISLTQLKSDLQRLSGALKEALLILGDRPDRPALAPTDDIESQLLDCNGSISEAQNAVAAALAFAGSAFDLDAVRRSLALSQENFLCAHRELSAEFVSGKWRRELTALISRPHTWAKWASSMSTSLQDCWPPMERVNEDFIHCWQELVEVLTISQKLKEGRP